MQTKFNTEAFDFMADQAKRLAEHSGRMRAEAQNTRKSIETVVRQLESVDLSEIMANMRKFATLARDPAGA